MNPQHSLSAVAAFLLAGSATAQVCAEVVDLNPTGFGASGNVSAATSGTTESTAQSFVQLGNVSKWLLSGKTTALGTELFITGGTPGSTVLLKDIDPTGSGAPTQMRAVGNYVYFAADDGVTGRELWRTDGTTAGTTLMLDLAGGPGGSFPVDLIALGDKLIFRANGLGTGAELYISDSVTGITTLLKDIAAGNSSTPTEMALDATGTKILFQANDWITGKELWVTDGTNAGTTLLKDIQPGILSGGNSGNPNNLVTANGKTYFTADDGTSGIELWVTDGTTAGTVLVKDIQAGSASSQTDLTYWESFSGALYFSSNDGTNGSELWKTDGTAAGTVMVADLNSGSGSSSPSDFTVVGGDLFFQADDGGTNGRELFKLDSMGTTSLVADINPGSADAFLPSGNSFMESGGKLAFKANDGVTGYELWVSDGTALGTSLVFDNEAGPDSSNPQWLTPVLGSFVMFSAATGPIGRELFLSGLVPATTGLLDDLDPIFTSLHSRPEQLFSFNGSSLLFQATDGGTTGRELWSWDPIAGTTLVADINPGPEDGNPEDFFSAWLGDHQVTFFVAETATEGTELWVTDGTTAGTAMLIDINPGAADSDPENFFKFNGKVYFAAEDAVNGNELWVTDGTLAGTQLVLDIRTGSSDGNPSYFAELNGTLFFRARTDNNGYELWSTDGTTAGTSLFKEIRPGSSSSSPRYFYEFGQRLFFSANDGTNGTELWVTDGTPAGTVLFQDINPGSSSSLVRDFMEINGLMIFKASDGVTGSELHVSDGTTAGTGLLLDAAPGSFDHSPSQYLKVGSYVYYSGRTSAEGYELWRTDGTATGTTIVLDVSLGTSGSVPMDLTAANGGFYFAAKHFGYGLWFSDGTPAGTVLVCEDFQSFGSSVTSDMTLLDGKLFFSANTVTHGNELHHMPVPGPYAKDLGLNGSGAVLTATTPRLGTTMTVACEGIAPLNLSLLAISAPVVTPTNFLTSMGSANWLDPATATLVAYFGGTNWSIALNLPSTPSLAGVQVNMQTLMLPSASFPGTSTNGLSIVLGL